METIEELGIDNLKIMQNDEFFKFGSDAVLLSDFVKELNKTKNVSLLDLGTGSGIIPLLLFAKIQVKEIYGIEIQMRVAKLAQSSVKLNNLQDKIKIVNADIKEVNLEEKYFKAGTFDIVTSNPPYKKQGTGLKSKSEFEKIARSEEKCTLVDIIECANIYLKPYGDFYMVHRPERLSEIFNLLKVYKFSVKNIRFVHPRTSKNANLVLVHAVKYAKDFLKVLEPKIMY
jgi:tRNA1Val (adenine37-N6)-methyltransferase